MKIELIILGIAFSLLSVAARGQSPTVVKQPLPPDRTKYALIITGISGEESYAKQFSDWKSRLRRALTGTLGFAEDRVTVLTEAPEEREGRATAESVRDVFARLRESLGSGQQLFIFLIGHGSYDGVRARFNLVGPDLAAEDFALLVNGLPTTRIVFVDMSSASGEFIKPLLGNGRIVITATRSGMEQNAPKFAENFIKAMENTESDLDKNRRLSVLEAFEYGTKRTTSGFEQAGKLVTEHALIDDNGDGVGHPAAEAGDGGLARVTYLDSLPLQQAGGDVTLAGLFEERMRMEGAIEQLKARKGQMKTEEYEPALEKMLIDLARLGRSIRMRQKR